MFNARFGVTVSHMICGWTNVLLHVSKPQETGIFIPFHLTETKQGLSAQDKDNVVIFWSEEIKCLNAGQ